VPRVYWRYTSPSYDAEYAPGIKISHYEALEAAGIDRKIIARQGAEAYLHQLLNHGFSTPILIPVILLWSGRDSHLYDFGMMGRIKTGIREQLMQTLFGIAQRC